MTNDASSDYDLVGVRPWLMGQIMFFFMMILPLGCIPIEYEVDWWPRVYAPRIYGVLWTYDFDPYSPGFALNTMWVDYNFLLLIFPTFILNVIFVLVLVGYYKGMINRNITILVGVLSVLIPVGATILTTGIFLAGGEYVGSLPILLIVALIFLHRVPGPEIIKTESFSDSN